MSTPAKEHALLAANRCKSNGGNVDVMREVDKCPYSQLDRAIEENAEYWREDFESETPCEAAEEAANEAKRAGLLRDGSTINAKWFLERSRRCDLFHFLRTFQSHACCTMTFLGDKGEFRGCRILSGGESDAHLFVSALVSGLIEKKQYQQLLAQELDDLNDEETEEHLDKLYGAALQLGLDGTSSAELAADIKKNEELVLKCVGRWHQEK